MKAPDKICIRKDDTSPLGFTCHWIYTTKVQEQDIEYIRKDALLEWAEKCKKIIEGSLRVKYDESLAIRGLMYAIFMDKLNEM